MIDPCLICGKPVEDYEPEFCCSGMDCGCQGVATNPCICSDACWRALLDYVGMPFEERRIKAGITLFAAPSGEEEGK